jgi:PAS domain S-box-containing protein
VIHGPDGAVQLWNAAAEDLFGWTEGEVVGDPLPPSVPPEASDQFRSHLERARSAGSISGIDIQQRTRDGERLDLQMSASLVEPTGDDERIVTIYSDVTELKDRERQLRRSKQRTEAFTEVLAHDLRNPLQVLCGQFDAIDDPAVDDAVIDRALTRIQTIIDDVVSLAREEPVVDDREAVRLSVVASNAWSESFEGSLVVESDRTLEADSARLEQLLGHLFENACCHGSRDGDVCVRVGCTDEGFYVADDGPGVDEDERTKVFDPGYSTSPGETGYGLNIVEEIAAAHGWSVSVAGSETGGARFVVSGVTDTAEVEPAESSVDR